MLLSLNYLHKYRLLQITEQNFVSKNVPPFASFASTQLLMTGRKREMRPETTPLHENEATADDSLVLLLAFSSESWHQNLFLSLHYIDDADTLTVRFISGSPSRSHLLKTTLYSEINYSLTILQKLILIHTHAQTDIKIR